MKRVSVMANDSALVDAIASVLAMELGPDVLQLTYQLPCNVYRCLRDHRSILIVIDEGGSEIEFTQAPGSCSNSPLLVIKAVLRTMNIDRIYQMIDPDAELVTRLVRDFRRTYLERLKEEVSAWAI